MSRTKTDSLFGTLLMGRPRNSVERAEQKKVARTVLRAIDSLGSVHRAARYFRVSPRTIQRWTARHKL